MNDTNKYKVWKLAASKVHNEASNDDNQEFDKLLSHSENQRIFVFDDVSHIHSKFPETKPLIHSSASRSWQKIAHHLKNKKIKLYLNIAKYVAIVVLAIGVGTLLQINWKSAPEMPPLYTEFIVPAGQMSEIALSDGTHVWLNSETTLRYADSFGKESRKVELSGEAFFKVNRNELPFKVKIKDNEVEVLGTSFAAIAYPDEDFSRVTLVEGSVQINDNNGITLKQLAPNQQVNIPDDKNEEITTTEVDQSVAALSKLLSLKVDYKSNLNTKDVITISKK